MYLSELPVDVFIKQITYLPFDKVVSVCELNEKSLNYCTDVDYKNHWKKLIDDTFSSIDGYDDKLKEIRTNLELGEDVYNYMVYTELIKLLDPITQLMIYYRQGDMKSFDKFTKVQKFLALFLLGKKDVIKKYLPDKAYQSFIDLLNEKTISKNILDKMLAEMASNGSLRGVKYFQGLGSNIHAQDDWALQLASKHGHLKVVKYLIENGADIHADNDVALGLASTNGHLDVVKYLVEKGADIHAEDDYALRWASRKGHLEVLKYLKENGANIHRDNDWALVMAGANGHLDVVKFLHKEGANIHGDNDRVLRLASENGHLDVVKYLVENGANVRVSNDSPIILASKNGHLNVVKYLIENGVNIHADNDEALRLAILNGHTNVVNYIKLSTISKAFNK